MKKDLFDGSARLFFASVKNNFYFKYFNDCYSCNNFNDKISLYDDLKLKIFNDGSCDVIYFVIFYHSYLINGEIFNMYDELKNISDRILVVFISDYSYMSMGIAGNYKYYDYRIYDNISPMDFEKYLMTLCENIKSSHS